MPLPKCPKCLNTFPNKTQLRNHKNSKIDCTKKQNAINLQKKSKNDITKDILIDSVNNITKDILDTDKNKVTIQTDDKITI